jgi:hypothetical protein
LREKACVTIKGMGIMLKWQWLSGLRMKAVHHALPSRCPWWVFMELFWNIELMNKLIKNEGITNR